MKLLLINTCGAEASVALADTELEVPVVAMSTMPGRTASESLVAVLRKTMGEAQWKLRELHAIAVVTGPGSFTGARVGLSAAKGLGEATGAPLLAISRLAMLAAVAGAQHGLVCALLDAGRGEFYVGQYGSEVEPRETLCSKQDALAEALLADKVVVCESMVFDVLSEFCPVQMVGEPGAAEALPFALKKIEAGLFDDPFSLDASYLRRTDAEIFAKRAG